MSKELLKCIGSHYHPHFVYHLRELTLILRIEPVGRTDDIFRNLYETWELGWIFGAQRMEELAEEMGERRWEVGVEVRGGEKFSKLLTKTCVENVSKKYINYDIYIDI